MTRAALLPEIRARSCDGPIVARLRRELTEAGIVADEIAISERSPYGRRALRLRFGGAGSADAGEAARRVAHMPWIGAVAAVPPNLYVQLPGQVMRKWAALAAEPLSVPESPRVTIIHADPESLSTGPLDVLRHVCTARGIAALLRSVGCRVEMETRPGQTSNAFACRSEVTLRLWSGETGQSETPIPVAGVDLPQGRLRARYGGMLQVRDLLRELDGQRSDERYGLALASFLMLCCPRETRLKLDEAKLAAGASDFATLTRLARMSADEEEGRGVLGTEADLVNMLLLLDATPTAIRRSLAELQPSHLLRHLRGLASAADVRFASGDPLRRRIAETLHQGLDHLALDVGEPPASPLTSIH